MQLFFALFILVALSLALYNRRKEKKTYVKAERKEESGHWIDKRKGERGTYGSLDEEMESARRQVAHQGRVGELTLLVRNFAFEQVPGFHDLSDAQIKDWNSLVRTRASEMLTIASQFEAGKAAELAMQTTFEDEATQALKKQILAFLYDRFPGLLALDLDKIQQFDQFTGHWAHALLEQIQA